MDSIPLNELPKLLVSQLKSIVNTHLSYADTDRYDESFLLRSIQSRMHEIHCHEPEEYGKLLSESSDETSHFLSSLQINYSEFFRNALTFSVLERIILPSLIRTNKETNRKEIRIWSAACASGQEPYSAAMLLEELKTGSNEKINYRIFATDQNETLVNEARRGHFSDDAIYNLTLRRIKQWFTKHGNTYTVKQELRNTMDFSVFDLLSEQLSCPPTSIFGDFDLVFCSNLLFYYKNDYRESILEKAGGCLASGGYLITGESEREILKRYDYNEVFPQSAIFQKK